MDCLSIYTAIHPLPVAWVCVKSLDEEKLLHQLKKLLTFIVGNTRKGHSTTRDTVHLPLLCLLSISATSNHRHCQCVYVWYYISSLNFLDTKHFFFFNCCLLIPVCLNALSGKSATSMQTGLITKKSQKDLKTYTREVLQDNARGQLLNSNCATLIITIISIIMS